MAYNFNGSTQYISSTTTPVTAVPITISAWFYGTSTALSNGIISPSNASGSDSFRLQAVQASIGQTVRGGSFATGFTTGNANTTTTWSATVWNNSSVVFASSTSRTVYLNNGGAGSNTTSNTPAGVNRLLIGVLVNASALFNYMSGYLAEIGIWNVSLNAAELSALNKNISPELIRPQSLVFYTPLIRELIDIRQGRALTNNNTATAIAHPRTYY